MLHRPISWTPWSSSRSLRWTRRSCQTQVSAYCCEHSLLGSRPHRGVWLARGMPAGTLARDCCTRQLPLHCQPRLQPTCATHPPTPRRSVCIHWPRGVARCGPHCRLLPPAHEGMHPSAQLPPSSPQALHITQTTTVSPSSHWTCCKAGPAQPCTLMLVGVLPSMSAGRSLMSPIEPSRLLLHELANTAVAAALNRHTSWLVCSWWTTT